MSFEWLLQDHSKSTCVRNAMSTKLLQLISSGSRGVCYSDILIE